MKNIIKYALSGAVALSTIVSCSNDFLDRAPLDSISPELYYRTEENLSTYTIGMYKAFSSHNEFSAGTFNFDNGTDNQAGTSGNGVFAKKQWRVGTGEQNWGFGDIRNANYFINIVEKRLKNNEISGNPTNINHYLGEGYFFRAYYYFNLLVNIGDAPIIKEVLSDDKELLIESSKRRPRNEVARFILEDLDKAISLLKSGDVENKNRISREVALLFKSRVALFEGSWEKYHKGTPFVPKGAGWPGEGKDYLKDYTIDIDSEINFFLSQAMDAAKQVADAKTLVMSNNAVSGQEVYGNPYYKMFADINMAQYSEVLLWRQYASGLSYHHNQTYLTGGAATGFTKSLVDSYLMRNGLPIYAANSGYNGDTTIDKVLEGRDDRLQMFVHRPGDYLNSNSGQKLPTPIPTILSIRERRATTGYMNKKGLLGDPTYYPAQNPSITGSIIFRATEAYLNYIEACYIRDNNLDATATKYWQQLRTRAGLPADFNITINATDLSKEDDWAKYSNGVLIDKTLYNIRRERRNEFIAEGMRWRDLKRWRALDQVKNYQIEGFNLWAEMYKLYKNDKGESTLREEPLENPNVSPKSNSTYLRPYQVRSKNNIFYEGYTWTLAHYLSPIGYRNFAIASPDGTAEKSVIYQNPYWPVEANGLPSQ